MSQLDDMIAGWKSHFWAADHEIEWRHVERPTIVWLSDNTLVAAVVDAIGYNGEGQLFFGEWKTANPREKNSWKNVWRMNPQSLTYGVMLTRDPFIMGDCSRFTVRKAFKERTVPTYDHAWFRYSPAELRHWEGELLRIADEIRAYRAKGSDPWPTNFQRCFQYGQNYACAFFEKGCNLQDWGHIPPDSTVKEEQPFVAEALAGVPFKRDLVILSPSRVGTWLGCREQYRKSVEQKIITLPGEALNFGKDFHAAIAEHYRSLMAFKGAPEDITKFVMGVKENG